MEKIKYKKIDENIFQKISCDEKVVDIVNLDNLKQSRDLYKEKHDRVDAQIKKLEAIK